MQYSIFNSPCVMQELLETKISFFVTRTPTLKTLNVEQGQNCAEQRSVISHWVVTNSSKSVPNWPSIDQLLVPKWSSIGHQVVTK